jgi:hypothetical protein
MVNLSGLLNMIAAGPFPGGGVMGNLPVGYRPEGKIILRVLHGESAGWVRVDLHPDGTIKAGDNSPIPVGNYLTFHHTWTCAP